LLRLLQKIKFITLLGFFLAWLLEVSKPMCWSYLIRKCNSEEYVIFFSRFVLSTFQKVTFRLPVGCWYVFASVTLFKTGAKPNITGSFNLWVIFCDLKFPVSTKWRVWLFKFTWKLQVKLKTVRFGTFCFLWITENFYDCQSRSKDFSFQATLFVVQTDRDAAHYNLSHYEIKCRLWTIPVDPNRPVFRHR
jgi:hypothetical protein